MKQSVSPNVSVPNILDKGHSAWADVLTARPEGLFTKPQTALLCYRCRVWFPVSLVSTMLCPLHLGFILLFSGFLQLEN